MRTVRWIGLALTAMVLFHGIAGKAAACALETVEDEAAFDALIARNDGAPVLVAFERPGCPNCEAVRPRLETLAEEVCNRGIVATADVDALTGVVWRYASGSITLPYVALFVHGEKVDEAQGYHEQSHYHDMMAPYLANTVTVQQTEAIELAHAVGGSTVRLYWTASQRDDFAGYKVVASTTNPDPHYPADGYEAWLTDRQTTSYELTLSCGETTYVRVDVLGRDHERIGTSNVIEVGENCAPDTDPGDDCNDDCTVDCHDDCSDDGDDGTPCATVFTDADMPICVAPGTCFTILLEGNPTTGTTWNLVEGAVGELLIDLGMEYVEGSGANAEVGVGGTYEFVFEACCEGETELVFAYARSWEDEAPLETRTFTVRVAPDCKDEPGDTEGGGVIVDGPAEVPAGETLHISAHLKETPEEGTLVHWRWVSENPEVATVEGISDDGGSVAELRALQPGKATIIAFADELGLYGKLSVRVLGEHEGDDDDDDVPPEGTVHIVGEVRYIDLEGGFYGIVGDDGAHYDPVNLDSEYREDGMRVLVEAEVLNDMDSIHQWGTLIEIQDIRDESGDGTIGTGDDDRGEPTVSLVVTGAASGFGPMVFHAGEIIDVRVQVSGEVPAGAALFVGVDVAGSFLVAPHYTPELTPFVEEPTPGEREVISMPATFLPKVDYTFYAALLTPGVELASNLATAHFRVE